MGIDPAEPIEQQVRIQAAPETVFEFLIDPQKMIRWKGVKADLDPRPGGIYRVDLGGKDIVAGTYLEVEPPDRVVFSWGWEGDSPLPPGSSTVEITLTRDGEGTILRLVHRDLPVQLREVHAQGWAHYLPRLEVAAAGGDPGPDEGHM